MDPDSTYRLMLKAFDDGRLEITNELSQSLKFWLRSGGFAPKVTVSGGGQLFELSHEQNNRAIAFAVASEIAMLATLNSQS